MAAYLDYVGTGNPVGGHYRMGFTTGLTTILAGGTCLFAFKWKAPGLLLVLSYLKVSAVITTAFTTAQAVDVAVYYNRQWSTDPSAGTTVTFTTPQTMRDSGGAAMTPFSQLLVAPVVQVATATAVTTGTRVQDGQAAASAVIGQGNAIGNAGAVELVKTQTPYEHPPVFGVNEGFEIQPITTQGAVGKVQYYFNLVLAVVNTF